jgi:urease accessory protein
MTWLRPARRLALAAAVSVPSLAHAHLTSTGVGPFYDGLTHLFVTPEDLLPVIALALLAGLHGPRFGRIVLLALPAAWLAGSLLGLLVGAQVTMPVATAAVTIALGAMVAAGRPLPLGLVACSAVALGLSAGALTGIDLATAHSSPLGAAGVTAALFVVVSLFAGQVAAVRASWARVAVQVAGSWIAAIGLFMLGWAVRAG